MTKIITSRLTLPVVWVFFFMLTHWPSEEMPDTPFIPHLDKVVHVTLYAVLSFLLSHRIAGTGETKKQIWTIVAVLGAYGIFDELTQPYVGRTAEFLDWIADLSGVLVGTAIHRSTTKKNVQDNNQHV